MELIREAAVFKLCWIDGNLKLTVKGPIFVYFMNIENSVTSPMPYYTIS